MHKSFAICIVMRNNLLFWTSSCRSITHWGRATHICIGNLTIFSSGNGLSPGRRQPIIWTNAKIFFKGPLGTNFIEISIEIHTFSLKEMSLNCRLQNGLFRNGVNVLMAQVLRAAAVLLRSTIVHDLCVIFLVIKLYVCKTWMDPMYRQIPNTIRTKSQTLNVSCLVLQLSLPNPLKPGIKLKMKK